jgi:hypothetical protein
MLLYNMTVGIDKEIEQEWLQWIREVHIPQIMSTGLFTSAKIFKVLHDNDDNTTSYSMQYFAESIGQVNEYLQVFAPKFVGEHRMKFHNRHVAFQTLLEEV